VSLWRIAVRPRTTRKNLQFFAVTIQSRSKIVPRKICNAFIHNRL
jgi:hypothetical protein